MKNAAGWVRPQAVTQHLNRQNNQTWQCWVCALLQPNLRLTLGSSGNDFRRPVQQLVDWVINPTFQMILAVCVGSRPNLRLLQPNLRPLVERIIYMTATLKKSLLPVAITFLICLGVTFIIFSIFNWDLIKETFYWFLRTAEKWSYEFIVKIVSILILFISLFLYPKFVSKKLKYATDEEIFNFYNIDYIEKIKKVEMERAEEKKYIHLKAKIKEETYLEIKKDLNYWLECVEKLAVLIAMIGIYVAASRFFSTESILECAISTVSLIFLPISVVFMYLHYTMKLLFSVMWAKYPPLKNHKKDIPSDQKVTFVQIIQEFKKVETWKALGYIVLISFLSVVLIFQFPIVLGMQMAPVKSEPFTYCQIKDLPPDEQSWCEKQKNNIKK